MSIEEYMIGDWVMDTEPTFYTQVTSGMIYEGYDWEPVPLTEDILNANGIKYQWGSIWYQYNPFDSDIYEILCGNGCLNVRYVHELQHFLRLYGFRELADNFKIKP